VVRRLFPVFVLGLFLFAVPSALAQTSPTQTAEHQDGLNTVSGADGPDPSAAPGATPEESVENQYPDNSVETFRFEVQEGEENGSFEVAVAFPTFEAPNPNIDLDIYVYRIRDNGTLDPNPIASAATLDDPEIASYSSADPANPLIRADEYIVAVHNYCSQTSDLPDSCPGLPDQPDDEEDRWEAEVTFAPYDPTNQRPTASLSGPTRATTGQSLTYTATAADPDGSIAGVKFDLNGDGTHETDAGAGRAATTSFANPGLYTVGVLVTDNEGARAFASVDVEVTGAPVPPAGTSKRKLLSSFRLNRPVFGGRKRNRLVIRYRLREPGRVIVSLYRGKSRVRRLSAGNRVADRTYTLRVRPRKLKRRTYTVRITVLSADGKAVQRARLSAKRL
jgi:PKD domain